MKHEFVLVSMLFVVMDGCPVVPVEKTRNKKKVHQLGASYGHSDA